MERNIQSQFCIDVIDFIDVSDESIVSIIKASDYKTILSHAEDCNKNFNIVNE